MSKVLGIILSDEEEKLVKQFKAIKGFSDSQFVDYIRTMVVDDATRGIKSYTNSAPSVRLKVDLLRKLNSADNFKKPVIKQLNQSTWVERPLKSRPDRIGVFPTESEKQYLYECLFPVYIYLRYVFTSSLSRFVYLSVSEDNCLIVKYGETSLLFKEMFCSCEQHKGNNFSYNEMAAFAEELAIQAVKSCGCLNSFCLYVGINNSSYNSDAFLKRWVTCLDEEIKEMYVRIKVATGEMLKFV